MTDDTSDTNGQFGEMRADESGAPAASDPTAYKVIGELSASDAVGVLGRNTATSGTGHGVWGVTSTPNGAGVHGEDANGGGYGVLSTGDGRTEGDHEVTGSLSVGKTTCSVYLDSPQTVGTSRTRVAFDGIEADHFGGWDDASYEYTIPADGDYHLDVGLNWKAPPSDTVSELWVVVNFHDELRHTAAYPTTLHGSRTFTGLSSGDTVRVDVSHDQGSGQDLQGNSPDTYLTISRVG